jgi:hypothetical protein
MKAIVVLISLFLIPQLSGEFDVSVEQGTPKKRGSTAANYSRVRRK